MYKRKNSNILIIRSRKLTGFEDQRGCKAEARSPPLVIFEEESLTNERLGLELKRRFDGYDESIMKLEILCCLFSPSPKPLSLSLSLSRFFFFLDYEEPFVFAYIQI
jgi:hypothetical protein